MDSNIKASFIPDRKATSGKMGTQSAQGGLGDIVFLISIVVLATAVALAAGVFLYNRYITASIHSKNVVLTQQQGSFDSVSIAALLRLDQRLKASTNILAMHLAPSEVFTILEQLTLKSVEYKSLKYAVGTDNTISIKIEGKAQSVNGVALQASVFGQNSAIINPIFSNINLKDGGVSFSVAAILDPSILQYILVEKKRAALSSDTSVNTNEASNVATTTTPDTTMGVFEPPATSGKVVK